MIKLKHTHFTSKNFVLIGLISVMDMKKIFTPSEHIGNGPLPHLIQLALKGIPPSVR